MANGTKNWIDPTDDPRIAAARQALVEAVIACIDATGDRSIEDRRMRREFDPTWKQLRERVKEYTRVLRQSGEVPEHTIDAIKEALTAAVPTLAPHNAIRSSAVTWCIEAYYEKVV